MLVVHVNMKLSVKVIDSLLTDDVFDVFSGRCEYEAVNHQSD